MTRSSASVRRLGLIVAIPLLLIAIGAWQFVRADADTQLYQEHALGLDEAADRLAPDAARAPFATMKMGDRYYGLAYGLTLVRDAADRQRTNILISELRRFAAALTALGGLLTLVAGAIGLLAAARVAGRTRTSRATLVAQFTSIRRMLPFLLMAQVAGLLVAVVSGILFEVAGLWDTALVATFSIRIAAIAMTVAGTLAWIGWLTMRRLRQALAEFTPAPNRHMGREVEPADAPGLFALIAAIVTRQGSLAPDHVVVGLIDGFFVTMSAMALLPSERTIQGRTLYLSVSQTAMLGRAEISCVLAHELAHFAGEDTDYSQRFLPIYHGIGRSLSAVRNSANPVASRLLLPASTLGLHMMEVFDAAVSHWSRLREFSADAGSMAPGEAPALAGALIRTGLIAPVIEAVLSETWAHPRSAPADLVAAMRARAEQSGFGDATNMLERRQPHPSDSHPQTRQRIEALGIAIDNALLARAARPVATAELVASAELFADWDGLCTALSADAVAIAAEHDDAVVAALVRTAALPTREDRPIFEDLRAAYIAYGLTAGFGFGVGGFLLYAAAFWTLARPDAAGEVILAGSGLMLLGVLAVSMVVRRLRARGIPFLVLNAHGFRGRNLDHPVAWDDIEGVSVVAGRATTTVFFLARSAALPVRTGGHRVRIGKRRHTVALSGIRPRGMTIRAYYDLILSYLAAARATAALAARAPEGGVAMILSEQQLIRATGEQPET